MYNSYTITSIGYLYIRIFIRKHVMAKYNAKVVSKHNKKDNGVNASVNHASSLSY